MSLSCVSGLMVAVGNTTYLAPCSVVGHRSGNSSAGVRDLFKKGTQKKCQIRFLKMVVEMQLSNHYDHLGREVPQGAK